jgi:hypothetical protein
LAAVLRGVGPLFFAVNLPTYRAALTLANPVTHLSVRPNTFPQLPITSQRIDDYRHRMAPKSTKAIPLKWIQQNVLALLSEETISSYEVLENLRDYAVKIAEVETTVSNSHRINPGKLYHSNQKHVAPCQRRGI